MHTDVLLIDVSRLAGLTMVTVGGEIDDHSAPTLRAALDGLEPDEQVMVDMSDVTFMDSAGLSVLAVQATRMGPRGGQLHINRASRFVRRVVSIAGLTDILLDPESRGDFDTDWHTET
jgi:anti-sigma B factor antagonist